MPALGPTGLMIWEGNEDLEDLGHCISTYPVLSLCARHSLLVSRRPLLPLQSGGHKMRGKRE